MSTESPHREPVEPRNDRTLYEIQLGIPFKPFRYFRRFRIPGEGFSPLGIPERYDHILALRKPISLYGMTGCIDLISEDPENNLMPILQEFYSAQPLGVAGFESVYRGPKDHRITDLPYILRFSFLIRTPAEYTKLLNSYADVKLGERNFLCIWNLGRTIEETILRRLEAGLETLVVEKNLFEVNELKKMRVTEAPQKKAPEKKDKKINRISFVWLPKNIKKFRTIEITFGQFFDRGDEKPPEMPIDPTRDKILTRT